MNTAIVSKTQITPYECLLWGDETLNDLFVCLAEVKRIGVSANPKAETATKKIRINFVLESFPT